EAKKTGSKKRLAKKRLRKQIQSKGDDEKLKVMSEGVGTNEDTISEEVAVKPDNDDLDDDDDDDETDPELDFELQRKLLRVRKLYHRSNIQEVIKEGQVLLVQVVKEERGNKGAALTTYLSLAGRYCVLMPNRIKSGGVSRKITNASDRKRLKSIVKELPLTADMSMIVRTAGEEKTKTDIVRDYNYLMRSWNKIRIDALKTKAPALIHEEGNLIKRALRDMYTKEISEIIVSGDEAYKMARDFTKILSPHNLKKIKQHRNGDMPLFQRFQVESQLDKLHDTTVQLESGGYLVINPTEALVAIDVNSGRATKEKDLEETALKTNLEAADEVARQLRLRNLAGLVVIDFIDMDEPKHNQAVEKRIKEAMKTDRSRIQIGKMSQFGLLEISRQRMHSSFFESNYHVCPHCKGKGIVRSVESCAVLILRAIEEEGIKNRSCKVNVFVPSDIAIYLLNQKRQALIDIENKYKLGMIVSADDSIKNIADYRMERVKKSIEKEVEEPEVVQEEKRSEESVSAEEPRGESRDDKREDKRDDRRGGRGGRGERRGRHGRRERNNNYNGRRQNRDNSSDEHSAKPAVKEEAVVLYNSHGSASDVKQGDKTDGGEKTSWWQKLIK
ncbi:MAG: Rne/Rng family ribonuclease, partial [Lactobacillus sp.]|nr:Rne/Rng family ribonuclease [Lactobacillus sp.]